MSFEFISTPENLRQEELIVQITEHLQLIDKHSDRLFRQIENQLNNICLELDEINNRSEICSGKISKLCDEKKAITLYSHSKFPSGEVNPKEFYQSFIIDDNCQPQFGSMCISKQINSTHIPYDDDSKLKSQFYIYDKQINKHPIPDRLNESHIPWQHVSSIGSLLLFNSSENAYTLFENQPNKLKHKVKPKSDKDDPNGENDSVRNSVAENIDFNLTFHSAPQILHDLPSELPSLPGIADEFKYEDSVEMDLVDVSQLVLPDLALLSRGNNLATLSMFENNSETTFPSSSMMENVEKVSEIAISANEMLPPGLPSPPPPPPPPPPPSPPPPSLTPSKSASAPVDAISATPKLQTETLKKTMTDNGRASLLESIRAAGGKPKQKTIKERKHDEKLKKKDEKEQERVNGLNGAMNSCGGGIDMMAELRKRLESRRSGLSNDHVKTKLNPNLAFTNISAMIPVPEASTVDDPELTEDEEAFEDWD